MTRAFVVHHNPDNKRYKYITNPEDAVASAQAMLTRGESTWVAGNCRRMIGVADLLLFKFGGARLQQDTGIYAAARVTRAPAQNGAGAWVLRYETDPGLTRHLLGTPIFGKDLARLVPRSFGASIQAVSPRGCRVLRRLLGINVLSEEAMRTPYIDRGLLILKEPLDKILAGTKTWEIRGKATWRRGAIALIECREASLFYVLQHLRVDREDGLAPEARQIVVRTWQKSRGTARGPWGGQLRDRNPRLVSLLRQTS